MGRVRTSQRWLKCTHRGAMVWFFCFVWVVSKSFLVYIIFWTPMESLWSHTSPCIACGHTSYLAYHQHNLCSTSTEEYLCSVYISKQVELIQPTQLKWNYCWGILFTLGVLIALFCAINHRDFSFSLEMTVSWLCLGLLL